MKIMKSTNIELDMLQQIEEHMKIHGISYAEFTRRAAASYLDHNPNVTEVSIQDDIIDDVVKEALKDIPKDTEPPPNDDAPKKNDFNFDDI